MSVPLPDRPHLEHLRKQARDLLRAVRRGDPTALARLRARVRLDAGTAPQLAHAQLALAREHGFASWPRLKAHVAQAQPVDPAAAFAAAVRENDTARTAAVLARHPELRSRLDEPVGDFGATALLCAVQRGNQPLAELLLEAGADVNARSDWWAGGFGVLELCPPAMAPWLVARGARVDAHAAARLGLRERLRELLDADPALVHARGGDGKTPLHYAADAEIALLLLDRGAAVDARDVDHESTPAQYMVRDGQPVARLLVERGANTDILLATALGDLERVRRHLDADPASIGMAVSDRWFPRRDPRAGGTIYIWTLGWHRTPDRVAREFGRDEVYALLMERTPPVLALAIACQEGDEARMEALLAADPALAASLPDEVKSRLPAAAQDEDPEAVRRLLAAGWPVDTPGDDGATALHWAAWHGDLVLVRELLRRGAPAAARDHTFDGTPLSWAAYASVHGWHPDRGDYAGVVEVLAASGAPLPDATGSAEVRAALRRLGTSG